MKKALLAVIIVAALILTSAAVEAKKDGVSQWLERIANTLDGIKNALSNIQRNTTVNVYPAVSAPNVSVINEVPVPDITNEINITPRMAAVISLKCGWYSGSGGIVSSCVPPSCPEGYTDFGKNGNAATGVSGDTVVGYSERWCAK